MKRSAKSRFRIATAMVIVCFGCGLFSPLPSYSDDAEISDVARTSESAFEKIAAIRTELDHELQTDLRDGTVNDLASIRDKISKQAKQLSNATEIFWERFPTDHNFVEAARQGIYGQVLSGMLQKEDSLIPENIAERIPTCLFEVQTAKNVPISVAQAARVEAAAEAGFADAAIDAIQIGPESYNGLYHFIRHARTDAGKRLVRALLESPSTDDSWKQYARIVLNRKFSVGQSLSLRFTALDGKQVDISRMRGEVVLIDFWETHCVPCISDLPKLKSLEQKYRNQGFEIIGIDSDGQQDAAVRKIQEESIYWPNYCAADGSTNRFAADFGVNGLPDYWLVDRRGIVREMDARYDLEKKIQFLVAETQ